MRVVRLLAIASILTAACGGGDNSNGEGNGDPDATTGDATDTGEPQFEIGGGCISAADCDGGVCVEGKCCSSADAVCGGGCCATGTVCLFDKCVTPGGPCYTGNDCKPDEYCETALGGTAPASDAGVDGGGACLEPPPIPGKCVKRPAVCPDGMPDAGDCIPKCEYRPPVANLNAVIEWSWNATNAKQYPNFVDVWSTPMVGRIHDANCDGKIDQLDPPNVVYVSGRALDSAGTGTCCQCNGTTPTSCHTGVLRMLNGRTGTEIWSLRQASTTSVGFSGLSTAIGDLTGDGKMDIAAVTGEGLIVIVDGNGKVVRTSDKPIPGGGAGAANFGWGGGLAISDMDRDGFPEIAYGGTVFTTKDGKLTLLFGTNPNGYTDLSTFVDLDTATDGNLELLVGTRAVKADGTNLWNRTDITDGFPAVGDFDKDGKPEVVLVNAGKLYILNGATGATIIGPFTIPGTGSGGPPTVADFDGDKFPEVGVAMQNMYSVLKPDLTTKTVKVVWSAPNHDLSSSVTGSSVFDFEGDGRAEVIYNDECFLWVYDGPTGKVRFAGLTTSFTATEASVVADVDGDGRAEILMGSNRADPSSAGWRCNIAPWNTADVANNRPAWKPPTGGTAYSGITVFGDSANAWVGTRTLWSEHTYHVTNVCDDRDSACDAPNVYGSIPKGEKKNWTLPWLNNFRQNVQDKGIFDAPDATVSLAAKCTTPVQLEASLRNAGLASLPAGVEVGFYVGTPGTLLGKVKSTRVLFPGQTEVLPFTAPSTATKDDLFYAKIEIDPLKPTFQQCRTDNDKSAEIKPACPK
jgi:hypothetical protein